MNMTLVWDVNITTNHIGALLVRVRVVQEYIISEAMSQQPRVTILIFVKITQCVVMMIVKNALNVFIRRIVENATDRFKVTI